MRAYWLLGCLFLTSCGASTQDAHKGGPFVDVGANSFAIFTEAEHVTVIKLGQDMIANAKEFTKMALMSISTLQNVELNRDFYEWTANLCRVLWIV